MKPTRVCREKITRSLDRKISFILLNGKSGGVEDICVRAVEVFEVERVLLHEGEGADAVADTELFVDGKRVEDFRCERLSEGLIERVTPVATGQNFLMRVRPSSDIDRFVATAYGRFRS